MSSNGTTALKIDFEYNNDLRFVDALVYFYAKAMLDKKITQQECHIIREYILRGYSDSTKRHIEKSLKIKSTNLNVYNYNLQKKGFLLPHTQNQNYKVLNPQLLELREFYQKQADKKVLIINFIDTNV